jgi:cyclopropane-fatty-acyl-phospholipid synthase
MDLKSVLDRALRTLQTPGFSVEYWDGQIINYGTGRPEFAVRVNDATVVKRIMRNVLVQFPDAYVDGEIEISGDLQSLLRVVYDTRSPLFRFRLADLIRLFFAAHFQRASLEGAKRNVRAHYDLGNEFFAKWLDPGMVYSGAYFENPTDALDKAQSQKLEHLCRKLRLENGQRLLDIGCGWGGLILHAAERYGVRATGITLSAEQQAFCASKITSLGLESTVEARLQDYRQLGAEKFDRIVSVGMIEHVGKNFLPAYARAVADCLYHDGIGVFQTMGKAVPGPVTPWITKHIFPGMYLPALGEISDAMSGCGLHIIDVENLRPHYAMTLDAWASRFERCTAEVAGKFGEHFVRMWRMYLTVASAAFKYGDLNLWQITFARSNRVPIPLTRRYVYNDGPPGETRKTRAADQVGSADG